MPPTATNPQESNTRNNNRERITMKEKSLILTLVLGMLAALPAQAGSGLIRITHARHVQPEASSMAKPQPMLRQANSEIQVAVMATLPSQQTPRRSVLIHR
jgi:hypothetical protein